MADLLGMLAQLPAASRPAHGPVYVETDLTRIIVEPWNAASAGLFLAIVAYWAWRLRGRVREHLFIAVCLPLLLVGAVGGTVYHAFRGAAIWLMMDWMPIVILCVSFGVYLWSRVWRWWPMALTGVGALFLALRAAFTVLPIGLAVNLAYAGMAAYVLVPAGVVLWRTRLRWAGYVVGAALCFAAAISARVVDAWAVEQARAGLDTAGTVLTALPMGTHFLWHVFGALATHLAIAYVYRLDRAPALRSESRSRS